QVGRFKCRIQLVDALPQGYKPHERCLCESGTGTDHALGRMLLRQDEKRGETAVTVDKAGRLDGVAKDPHLVDVESDGANERLAIQVQAYLFDEFLLFAAGHADESVQKGFEGADGTIGGGTAGSLRERRPFSSANRWGWLESPPTALLFLAVAPVALIRGGESLETLRG